MKRNSILLYLIGLIALSGCQQEVFDNVNDNLKEVKEGDLVKLDFSLVTSDFSTVSTRMTTEQENQWDVVWVAQFDSNGDLLAPPKQYPNSAEKIDIVAVSGQNSLYFITNVTENPFITTEGTNITNLSDLNNCRYVIDNINYFDNATKLVMVGVWNGEFIGGSTTPGDNPQLLLNEIVVYAKRLTSKINIVVNASLPNVTFLNKEIIINSLQLCGIPLTSTYVPGSAITSGADAKDFETETFTDSEKGRVTYTSKSYYVLENMQGTAENDQGAPMKGAFAPKDSEGRDMGTYVKIRAFINDGKYTGNVDYRVYLGKDADKNFDIERNYHYTITINIQGKGPDDISTDVRIESIDDLHQIQLQMPNGGAATNRASELCNIDANKGFWGWDGVGSGTSKDHLIVHTDGTAWTLDSLFYSTTPSNTSYVWDNLSLEYSIVEGQWHPVVKGEPAPSGAKIRLITDENKTSYDRTATFWLKLHNVDNNTIREWRVRQYKAASAFNVPAYSFFPGKAGVYALAIRSGGATTWKYDTKTANDNTLKFIGTVGADGFKNDANAWQQGHGAVLFEVKERGNFTDINAYRGLGKVTMIYKSSEEETNTLSFVANLYQLPTAQHMLTTLNAPTGTRFAYEYSSDPLFTTVVGISFNTPWAINMLDGDDTKYDDNKGLIGTTSPVTGKENTLQMFNKMDKLSAERLSAVPSSINVKGTPVFSPAGICMSLNEEYWEIEDVNDSRYEWYLPSRNEALMDALTSMLGLLNGGNGTRTNIWSSTVPASTTKESSAYFAGMSVDVSSTYSVVAGVRCIRRKKENEISPITYPSLRNVANTPVIVIRENGKGFVDRYRTKPATSKTERYYHVGYPLRFTSFGYAFAEDGKGPIHTLDMALSPKFQVAKQDVPGSPMIWYVASGWLDNLNFNELANPETGCQSYVEVGSDGTVYDDWRLPTEIELRVIGLLGGGTSAGAAQQYILQRGGVNFTDIPGFKLMNGNYWAGTEFISSKEENERASYVGIYDLKDLDSPLRGSAYNRTKTSYKVRCVRDIKD